MAVHEDFFGGLRGFYAVEILLEVVDGLVKVVEVSARITPAFAVCVMVEAVNCITRINQFGCNVAITSDVFPKAMYDDDNGFGRGVGQP